MIVLSSEVSSKIGNLAEAKRNNLPAGALKWSVFAFLCCVVMQYRLSKNCKEAAAFLQSLTENKLEMGSCPEDYYTNKASSSFYQKLSC